MIDLMTVYMLFMFTFICMCVALIAVSLFWDCFKEEIMQVRISKAHKKALEMYEDCEPVTFNEKENEIEDE